MVAREAVLEQNVSGDPILQSIAHALDRVTVVAHEMRQAQAEGGSRLTLQEALRESRMEQWAKTLDEAIAELKEAQRVRDEELDRLTRLADSLPNLTNRTIR